MRELDRLLAGMMRSVAKHVAMNEKVASQVTPALVEQALGKSRFSNDTYTKGHPPGVVVGLAWTSAGGDILFVETLLSRGKGLLTLTGNLGDVMKESTSTALSYLKAHASEYGIPDDKFEATKIHVHVT